VLRSGTTSAQSTYLLNDLIYRQIHAKPGLLTIEYAKDTMSLNNSKNGAFAIRINDETFTDVGLLKHQHEVKQFPLPAGFVEIAIRYAKYSVPLTVGLGAEIFNI
jgi:hypothetical protein